MKMIKYWSDPDSILTSFCPVVTSTALPKDEVVGTEKVTKRTRANRIHCSGFKINQDGTGNVLVRTDLVVVNRDTFQLQVIISLVKAILIDTMLV